MKFFVNLISYTQSGWIEVDAVNEAEAQIKATEFKPFVPCGKRRWDEANISRPNKKGEPAGASKLFPIWQTWELCEEGD